MQSFDIIIPVFNALNELSQCVRTVLKHTPDGHRIIILNDASTESGMREWLTKLEEDHPSVTVRHSPVNRGFLQNVNAGLKESDRDIILLNSDIWVASGWLEGLQSAYRSRENVGIVSPLLSEGAFLSFPRILGGNQLDSLEAFEERAERLSRFSPKNYPEIPAGIGCCMLISRKVINAIGVFDTAFGLGYWEEIDFSLRAKAAGFKVLCADDVYVYHHGGKSFSKEVRESMSVRNRNIIDGFWPGFRATLSEFMAGEPFQELAHAVTKPLS